MTMYNEDEGLFTRTMQGVMKNIAYLCKHAFRLSKSLSTTVTRSDGLGALERSPADRPHANLHPHTCHIRPPADNRSGDQLQRVDGFPLSRGILWLSNPRHGRRDRRALVLPAKSARTG